MLALLTGLMDTLSTLLFEELCLKYFILRLNQLYLIVTNIFIFQTWHNCFPTTEEMQISQKVCGL